MKQKKKSKTKKYPIFEQLDFNTFIVYLNEREVFYVKQLSFFDYEKI